MLCLIIDHNNLCAQNMPYFCVTPHVVNKSANVGRVSKNLFK
jgi:hypothetical protein